MKISQSDLFRQSIKDTKDLIWDLINFDVSKKNQLLQELTFKYNNILIYNSNLNQQSFKSIDNIDKLIEEFLTVYKDILYNIFSEINNKDLFIYKDQNLFFANFITECNSKGFLIKISYVKENDSISNKINVFKFLFEMQEHLKNLIPNWYEVLLDKKNEHIRIILQNMNYDLIGNKDGYLFKLKQYAKKQVDLKNGFITSDELIDIKEILNNYSLILYEDFNDTRFCSQIDLVKDENMLYYDLIISYSYLCNMIILSTNKEFINSFNKIADKILQLFKNEYCDDYKINSLKEFNIKLIFIFANKFTSFNKSYCSRYQFDSSSYKLMKNIIIKCIYKYNILCTQDNCIIFNFLDFIILKF
ncbi:MAG: hypothetical protein U1E31_01060 [Rickettsiales bacterium]